MPGAIAREIVPIGPIGDVLGAWVVASVVRVDGRDVSGIDGAGRITDSAADNAGADNAGGAVTRSRSMDLAPAA
jgi:hypothetical protein